MRTSRRLWVLSGFSAGLLLANLLANPHGFASTWRHLTALIMSQADTIATYGPPALVILGIVLTLAVTFPVRRVTSALVPLVTVAAIFITATPYELASRVFDRKPKENHK